MLKILKMTTPSSSWMVHVISGMRNPMNSWKLSDSAIDEDDILTLGEKDEKLMRNLSDAGASHRKFMRMMPIILDIEAPLYWWKEFDTYKVGTVANSCSTMHKIQSKRFTLDDFSLEHVKKIGDVDFIGPIRETITYLNTARDLYLKTGDKEYWWQMIQLLPSSYNQRRTVMMDYEVAKKIRNERAGHKLDEWHTFNHYLDAHLPWADILVED